RETGLIDAFPAGGPKRKWTAPVGHGYAGPAVADGRVYAADWRPAAGETLETGFAKSRAAGIERVVCLDQMTGKQLWKHEYPCTYALSYAGGPRCTPTVDSNRVYALGAMGDLICLAADTGKVVWSKNFVRDYDAPVPVWGFACHPLVDGDKLICLTGGTND